VRNNVLMFRAADVIPTKRLRLEASSVDLIRKQSNFD
jgi:hypothetical protein